MLRSLDVFSNVGSHAIGFEAAGIATIGFCEIDLGRRSLLWEKFSGVSVARDIHHYTAKPKAAEIIVGGPPCKATSVASAMARKRTGETLWPEMFRVGNELEAEWFVVEQPPGNSQWESQVADDLAQVGYHTARVEFSASDLGAPHIRRRVFILANRCVTRLSLAWKNVPEEIKKFTRVDITRHPWRKGPPVTVRVDDGPSDWLDSNAAVAAIGDSNPPAMAFVIGRSIMLACEVLQ